MARPRIGGLPPEKFRRRVLACTADHVLRTDRLELRPADSQHAADFLNSIDDELRAREGLDQATIESYRRSLNRLDELEAKRGTSCRFWFFVFEKSTDAFLGHYVMGPLFRRIPTWGGWVTAAAQNQGYDTESLAAILSYAHGHLRTPSVALLTTNDHAELRQLRSVGATLLESGSYQRPDGSVVAGSWFVHTA